MDLGRSRSGSTKVLSCDGGLRGVRRCESAVTGGGRLHLNRKDRQHGVANEFEDFAAARFDRVAQY